MSKIVLKASLGKNSFNHLAKQLSIVRDGIKQGANLGIEEATKKLYEKVIENCKAVGITKHDANIYYEYDKNTNIGRVWTDDVVIMFNEFGTGVVGKNNSHDWSKEFDWQYDVNNHGDKGWLFYNEEEGFGGRTKGLEVRRMFYNALVDMEDEIASEVSIGISKTIKNLY